MEGFPSRLDTLLRAGGWKLLAGAAATIALIVLANDAWRRSQERIANRPEYRVMAKAIEVTPQPAWIRGDVKSEVIRDSGLSRLNLLERDLTKKIAQAFAVHTWVARVNGVEKRYPARIRVDIQYRQPAAMVEVPGGLYPIDAEGVLLPPDNFTQIQVHDFLRIHAGKTLPAGPVGTSWGDTTISAAAALAVFLHDDWREFKLYRILAPDAEVQHKSQRPATFELSTKNGARITWGRGVGNEQSGEPSASEKLARLRVYVKQHGALDELSEMLVLDLSKTSEESISTQTRRSPTKAPSITRNGL